MDSKINSLKLIYIRIFQLIYTEEINYNSKMEI